MITMLIVEDQISMREALSAAFTDTGRFKVTGELSQAQLAEIFVRRYHPDLILMDVCTEGNASGLTATRDIKSHFPKTKIVVMTAFDEVSYLPRARDLGADGFVYKNQSLRYFIETAEKVLNGEKCFPPPKTIPMPMGEMPLTPREMDVLRLVCKHMTNKEIGKALFISESTVKYHKSNMLAKTGFKKTVDLAFYMITNGWINPLY